MGEIADDIVNDMVDFYSVRQMPRTKVCKSCGERGLVWMKLNNRWVLGSKGEIHKCLVKPYPFGLKDRGKK